MATPPAKRMKLSKEELQERIEKKIAEIQSILLDGVPVIFLLGTTTHGKTTLIRHYMNDDNDADKRANARVSDDAAGTTKVPEWYNCTASDGQKFCLVDSSGIGDADTSEYVTVTFLKTLFDGGKACGALIINGLMENLGTTAKICGPLFHLCVKGSYENFLLVCTKCDREPNKKKREARMNGLKKVFSSETAWGSPPGGVVGLAAQLPVPESGEEVVTYDEESRAALDKWIIKMLPQRTKFEACNDDDLADRISRNLGFEENAKRVTKLKNELNTMTQKYKDAKAAAKKGSGIFDILRALTNPIGTVIDVVEEAVS